MNFPSFLTFSVMNYYFNDLLTSMKLTHIIIYNMLSDLIHEERTLMIT